jgi:hypothetical protein
MSPRTVWYYNFAGWLLFTLSALAFLWGALKAQDITGIIASLLFLVACLVFLVPVWVHRPTRHK